MARYIDADELLKYKAQLYDENGVGFYAVGTGNILRMPTADVVEVVRGKWIDTETGKCKCSHCKNTYEIKAKFLYSYCPNCGARMVEE